MRNIPILSGLWNSLTAPALPPTALSISETHLALIALRRRGREFEPRNLGVLRMPAGLIRASFGELNIADESALVEHLTRTATQAGMKRVRALSATLPAGSARSLIVTLESMPASRTDLEQMIEWKIERGLGQRAGDLRVNHARLGDFEGRPQWIVSAVREDVVAQYEQVFRKLGWHVGMIAPRHIGEAQWLMRQGIEDDQVVVSLHDRGFSAVVVRGREPILVREVECAPEEREDEFYRLMVFYRDRLLGENAPAVLSRLLTIGSTAEQRRFRDVLSSALERQAVSLDPQQIGLRVDPNAPFNHFAAAGGLATMAWG
jgi:Tfp pilus assembly PilM family ATPase